MDDEEETYRLWKIRKTIMQVGEGKGRSEAPENVECGGVFNPPRRRLKGLKWQLMLSESSLLPQRGPVSYTLAQGSSYKSPVLCPASAPSKLQLKVVGCKILIHSVLF